MTSPSLITGLVLGESERLVDNRREWESKLESADLVGHKEFLAKVKLPVCDSPLEATAWENGFVPEAQGSPTDKLEQRIQGSLPPLACMVSRPRQPIDAGESILRRYDAATSHTGFKIGSQDSVGTPRRTNIRSGARPSGSFLSHMWFVLGQQLPMMPLLVVKDAYSETMVKTSR